MKLILSLLLSVVVYASANNPKYFDKQGTPLYESIDSLSSFKNFPSLNQSVLNYKYLLEETKKMGYKADSSQNKKDIMEYLKALRKLQKSHDNIRTETIGLLISSMKKNDYEKFEKIIDSGMLYFNTKPILKEDIFSFYKKNESKGKIEILDIILEHDILVYNQNKISNVTLKKKNNYFKQTYSMKEYIKSIRESKKKEAEHKHKLRAKAKNIKIVGMKKSKNYIFVKKILDKKNLDYMEYDFNKADGMYLMAVNKATSMFLLIIDDKVFKEYNKQKILNALK